MPLLANSRGSSGGHSTASMVLAFATGAAFGSLGLVYRRYKNKPPKEEPFIKAERQLWNVVEQSFTGTMIYIFDELRLYDVLWNNGPSTGAELAHKTGWNERFLNEILSQAVSAGICVYFLGKFCIKPEYAHLLRDPDNSPKSMVGTFQLIHRLFGRADATVEAIKTGKGFDYDFGTDVGEAIDRNNRNFFQYKLVEEVLGQVINPHPSRSLVELLEQGITVADIGCGFGASTVAMAQRFPKSHFYAYEGSQKALLRIEERITEAGVKNVTVYNVAVRSVGQGPENGKKFDFVYAHDVMHDMANPRAFIKEVKQSMAQDGCWVIVDVRCSNTLKENLMQPRAPMLYGFSSLLCLPCSMSTNTSNSKTKPGTALGTCGFPPALAKRWMAETGFDQFDELEIESLPTSSCFVVA